MSRERRGAEPELPSRAGVDGAANRGLGVVVGDAGVTADAADDLVEPAVRRLHGHLRIRNQRTRHANGLGRTAGDELVGRLDVEHARGSDPRQPDRERPGVSRNHGLLDRWRRNDPDGAEVSRRVAEDEGEVVDALVDGWLDDCACARRVGRQPQPEAEARSGSTDGSQHRDQEAATVAPLVLAAVELRVDELLDQVPLRGQELDPVEPCFRRKLRGARVADNDLLDLRRGECPGLGAESRARHRRGCERRSTRRRRDLLAAAVQELDEEPRAVRLHRSGHTPVARDDLGEVAAEGVRGQ